MPAIVLDMPGLGGFAPRLSVTSLFSNLVTRPTGRAIRTGVESQLAEMEAARLPCLSVLDFSQVRILDYSCADEIVAKLLLRFVGDERPTEAFFMVRGLDEHHVEPIEAVLERHGLLLVAQDQDGVFHLLGATNPLHRAIWTALLGRRRAGPAEIGPDAGVAEEAVAATLQGFWQQRVVVRHEDGTVSPLTVLLEES
jgi:hypothetical protein